MAIRSAKVQSGGVGFSRWQRSPLCRVVAQFLIVTLVVGDIPCPRLNVAAKVPDPAQAVETVAPGTVHFVNATDPTCLGQQPCYPKITQALAVAQSGDTIRVQAGAYDEAVRITGKAQLVLEADPSVPEGSVRLTNSHAGCRKGTIVVVQASQEVTLRGLTLTGARGRAIQLRGGKKQNRQIVLERNRIYGAGHGRCGGGIRIGVGNPDTVVVNNLIYGNVRDGIRVVGPTTSCRMCYMGMGVME